MFLERLLFLCNKHNTDISNVLRSLGLSTSKGTAWRKGSIPNGEVLLMLANYFHVSTDYLLGNTDDPSPAGQKEKADSPKETDFKPTEKDWERAIENMSKEQMRVVMDMLMKKYVEE